MQFQPLLTKLLEDCERLAADTDAEIREEIFRHLCTNNEWYKYLFNLWTAMKIYLECIHRSSSGSGAALAP